MYLKQFFKSHIFGFFLNLYKKAHFLQDQNQNKNYPQKKQLLFTFCGAAVRSLRQSGNRLHVLQNDCESEEGDHQNVISWLG